MLKKQFYFKQKGTNVVNTCLSYRRYVIFLIYKQNLMVEQDKYSELLQDELFIQWRLLPDEELNEYWNEKISKEM